MNESITRFVGTAGVKATGATGDEAGVTGDEKTGATRDGVAGATGDEVTGDEVTGEVDSTGDELAKSWCN